MNSLVYHSVLANGKCSLWYYHHHNQEFNSSSTPFQHELLLTNTFIDINVLFMNNKCEGLYNIIYQCNVPQ